MVGERVRNALDREPIWRRASDRISPRVSRFRNRPGERIRENIPQFPQRNFGGGVGVGFVGALIMRAVKQYVPIGTEVEIAETERVDGGTRYTVNVDAPFSNIARVQAFFESASGFSNVLTDRIRVENAEIVRQRLIKDTYQIVVFVED